MHPYTLYYWSVPFRGQFVRAVLAFAGETWREVEDAEISDLMKTAVEEMPVPFMGPPVLVDHKNGFAVSQMPAIMLYLGDTLRLMPDDATLRALTMKVVNDANDVIDEVTLQGGQAMWTPSRWQEFTPRLKKWMVLWEETGRRHGLNPQSGYLLNRSQAGIADIVTATLWTTMVERFPSISSLLDEVAPMTSALACRVSGHEALKRLSEASRRSYGDAYCGGDIEDTLRSVADPTSPET